jgi:hypothetical protein
LLLHKEHIFLSQDLKHTLDLLDHPLPLQLQLVEQPRLGEIKVATMSQLIPKPNLTKELLDSQLTMVLASMAALTQPLMHLEANSPTLKLEKVNGGKFK